MKINLEYICKLQMFIWYFTIVFTYVHLFHK